MKWTPDTGFEIEVEGSGERILLRIGVAGSKNLSITVGLDAATAASIGTELLLKSGEINTGEVG